MKVRRDPWPRQVGKVQRPARRVIQPRAIPRERWPEAVAVTSRSESLGLELALRQLGKVFGRTLGAWRSSRFRPVSGWALHRQPLAPDPVGLVLGPLPLPQAPVVASLAVAATTLGSSRVAVTAPDEPEGGVSALTLAAAHLAGASELYALEPQRALLALVEGLAGLPACAHLLVPAEPRLVGLGLSLAARWGTSITFYGWEDLLVVAEGGVDPLAVVLELAGHAERSPWGRRGLITESEDLAREVARLARNHAPQDAQLFCWALPFEEAGARARALRPDVVWLLAAEPDRWLARLGAAGMVLLGPHTPPSLAEVALPPWLGRAPSGLRAPGPTPPHWVWWTAELAADRFSRLARHAASVALAEKRTLSAAALAALAG